MTEADVIAAEVFAWERYAGYVGSQVLHKAFSYVFPGDEASHGLYREWRAARDARDKLFRPRRQR